MAINFPASLDTLVNPQSTDSVATPSHSQQHADANDAIEALQVKVGVDNSTDPDSLDYRVATLENASVDTETIQDIAGEMFSTATHSGISVQYDDVTGKVNLTALYDNADAIDAVASALSVVTGLTKTYDPLTSTITLEVDPTVFSTKQYVDDSISNLIDAAPGVLDTLNEIAAAIGDDANFITTINNSISQSLLDAKDYTDDEIDALTTLISNNFVPNTEVGQADGVASLGPDGFIPNGQLNIDERIQDTAATMITSATHSGISVSYDDATGKLTFTTTGGGGGGASVVISSTPPTTPGLGDIWLDSDNGRTYIWDGEFWVEVGAGNAQAIASVLSSPPADPTLGTIWVNTSNAKTYIYDGAFWAEV